MPIIKSAIKKMRKDKLRTKRNQVREDNLRSLIKKTRIEKSAESLTAVFSALDKAVKVNLIHKNRANRLKSRLSKGNSQTAAAPKKSAPKKKIVKKTSK